MNPLSRSYSPLVFNETKLTDNEYALIRQSFIKLLDVWDNSAERLDILDDIISLRASFLISRVLSSFRLDLDEALELLRRKNNSLKEQERIRGDLLVAAIDNLIDFAAATEATMLEDKVFNGNSIDRNECERVFEKYYKQYADEENNTVSFAAKIAAWWVTISDDVIITYMTQQDERVRALHQSLEGLSFPKGNFPAELIPPIEWGCRCYLVANGFSSVRAETMKDVPTLKVNPVFKESLAKGGRIFSDAHRYFATPLPEHIQTCVKRLRRKFYGKIDS